MRRESHDSKREDETRVMNKLNRKSHLRLVGMAVAGVAVAIVVLALGGGVSSAVAGWGAACLVYALWVWISALHLDSSQTKEHATREDPSRAIADVLLITASVVSLGAIGITLIESRAGSPQEKVFAAAISVLSIVLSWLLIHTLFTLRYARLYYTEPIGGIDFNQDEDPHYVDFAYVAFTVGMTFQVSDTNLQSRLIRSAVLKHMLLSYLFGTVIVATIVNFVAGLS
jgi:uncharacterized membrane protein